MTLPYSDPSNPALPSPLFSDITAVRADHMRANNAAIFADLENLDGRIARMEDLEQTASSGGTLTLSVTNKAQQLITGTLGHTIVLPVVSTLYVGFTFIIMNNSTQSITVNSSGGNLVATVPPGKATAVTCILITGTTAASWKATVLGGDLVGPASAVNGNFSVFDGVTGKLLKDAGFGLANLASGYIPKFRKGLVLSNNSTTGINISVGAISDSSNVYILKLTTGSFYKVLQNSGAWAAGSGNNGYFKNAALAVGWYYAFIIRKNADGSIDGGFDDNATAANIPAGYTAYAYLGQIYNNSNNTTASILAFTQMGNRFYWNAPPVDFTGTGTTSAQTASLTVPPSTIATISASASFDNTAGTSKYVKVYPTFETDGTVSASNCELAAYTTATNLGYAANDFEIPVDASSQIRVKQSVTTATTYIRTRGWIDVKLPE